jgi:hypothetical protein
MMRRSLGATLIAALGFILVSCGGSDRLSREEFLSQGNAICSEGNTRIDAAAEEAFGGLSQDERPSDEQLQGFFDTLVPEIQGQLDAIGDLNPPEELEADVDNLLQVAQSSLDEIRDAGPQVLLTDRDPFAEANRLAGEVGLTACAE